MLTEFGKCLRRLRLDNNQLLKEMANCLNVTPAYLSSVENGKRKPTKELVNKIINSYALTEIDKQKIIDSYSKTVEEITINTTQSSEMQASLGLVFARSINSLTNEQIRQIKIILKDNK